jgi:guanylate kinase
MKLRYRLFRRNSGIFFLEDRATKQQESLRTRIREAAVRILHAKNEAYQQPAINLQIARAYLMVSDPLIVKRTWQHVMDEIVKTVRQS